MKNFKQELRIGNWVRFKYCNSNNGWDFTTITESCFESKIIEKTYKPVKITKQWLKNFGFNKGTNTDFHALELTIETGNYILFLYADNQDKYSVVTVGLDSQLEKILCKDIKYIHQLQNFYFSLTGEELPLQLR